MVDVPIWIAVKMHNGSGLAVAVVAVPNETGVQLIHLYAHGWMSANVDVCVHACVCVCSFH